MPLLIVGAILLFLAVLLCIRLRVTVGYDGKLTFRMQYLFFTLRMKERKAGKAKKAKTEKPAAPKKKPDVRELLDLFSRYSGFLKKAAASVRSRVRIDRLYIKLIIKEEDAAKTALLYGEACAVIYPVLSFISGRMHVKSHEIVVIPLFAEGQAEAAFEARFSAAPGRLIAFAVAQLWAFLIFTIRDKNSHRQQHPQKPLKDGALK